MSVNSYLVARSSSALLSLGETECISRSLTTLQSRLDAHFAIPGNGLSEHFAFGSYTRGTILPRRDDPYSDIDYMIVFKNGGLRPQAYLDRLRRFVDKRYSTSEIYQSSPTIVLELNHIRFELVPALRRHYEGGYLIPKDPGEWRSTDPNNLNVLIVSANRNNRSLIRPTIRLAKIWNAANGYVFDSYRFERWICRRLYFFCRNQRDYLFAVFKQLNTTEKAEWKNERIQRAKEIVSRILKLEKYGDETEALTEIRKLIPPDI